VKHTVSQVRVGRWGKNPAIRFPGEVVKAPRLGEGERVEITTRDGDIVIRRAVPKFTAEELRAKVPGSGEPTMRRLLTGARIWAERQLKSDRTRLHAGRGRPDLD